MDQQTHPTPNQMELAHSRALNFLTVGEAAKRLHVSIKTIRRWNADGYLHAIRNNQNHRLFNPIDLDLVDTQRRQYPNQSYVPSVYLTVSEAAEHLGLSVKTIRRWDKAGKIECTRNAKNQRLFTIHALDEAMKRHERELRLPLYYRTYNRSNIFPLKISSAITYAATMTILILSLPLMTNTLFSPPNPILTPPLTQKTIISNSNSGSTSSLGLLTTDEELPPLSAQKLELATSYRERPVTSTLQTIANNVAIDAPPTIINFPHIASTGNTIDNNKIVSNNYNNNKYLNDHNLPLIALAPIDIQTNTPATNSANYIYALLLTGYPTQNPTVDLEIIDNLRTPRINSADVNPNPTETLTQPPAQLIRSSSLPQTAIDSYGNVAPTQPPAPKTDITPLEPANQILPAPTPPHSGTNSIPAYQTAVTIDYPNLETGTIILITFEADYSPAAKYWVTKEIPKTCPSDLSAVAKTKAEALCEGAFTLHLDAPPVKDIPFSWVISN